MFAFLIEILTQLERDKTTDHVPFLPCLANRNGIFESIFPLRPYRFAGCVQRIPARRLG